MKARIITEIEVNNKKVAKDWYSDMIESIMDDVLDYLTFRKDISYDLAREAVDKMTKEDFIEIFNTLIEEIKNDKNF